MLAVANMSQSIPLCRRLRVEVIVEIVVNIAPQLFDRMAHRLSMKEGRRGQLELPVQGKDFALPNKGGCICNPLRREQVNRTDLIIIAEQAPGRSGRIAGFNRELIE